MKCRRGYAGVHAKWRGMPHLASQSSSLSLTKAARRFTRWTLQARASHGKHSYCQEQVKWKVLPGEALQQGNGTRRCRAQRPPGSEGGIRGSRNRQQRRDDCRVFGRVIFASSPRLRSRPHLRNRIDASTQSKARVPGKHTGVKLACKVYMLP